MQAQATSRSTFHSTRHRGLSYRLLANGDKVWWGYVPGRGRVRLQARGEREALAEYGELRGKARNGEKIAPRNVRFGDVVEQWWNSNESPRVTSTRRLYRMVLDKDILPRLGSRKLSEIDLAALKSLIAVWTAKDRGKAGEGLSKSTVENYLCPIRDVFAYAIENGLASSNPHDNIKAKHLPKASPRKVYEWSNKEIEALLDASRYLGRQPEARRDYSPLLTLAAYTGLRLGELLGLEWRDVDLGEKPLIRVERQWTKFGEITPPKTEKSVRRVPLWPEAVEALRTLHAEARSAFRARPEDPVFWARGELGRLSHRNAQRRAFDLARDHAGLTKELTFHSLRHAFASLAHHRRVPLPVVSAVMGHSNVHVTASVYVHLWGRDEAEDAFRAAGVQQAAFQGPQPTPHLQVVGQS